MWILILLALLSTAVLYGLFFLVFKLIWVLLKKQRNLWPLILAGVSTLAMVILTAVAFAYGVYRFVKPFDPIISAIEERTVPIVGSYEYKDPTYGFSMQLDGGIVTSHWLHLDDISVLVGFDTNAFVEEKQQQEAPLSAIFVVRDQEDDFNNINAQMVMAQILPQLKSIDDANGRVEITGDPQLIDVGENASGALLNATAYVGQNTQPLPACLLVAVKNNTVYYVIGLTQADGEKIVQSVSSFRFSDSIWQ